MIEVLSVGAGVQSTTVALMDCAGEFPDRIVAGIFADTMGEPGPVYRHLDWLETVVRFPIHRVTAGDLRASVLTPRLSKRGVTYYRTAIPFHTLAADGKAGRISHRTCTRDYKIKPILREVRRIVADQLGPRAIRRWYRDRDADWLAYKLWLANQAERRKAEKHGRPKPASMPFPRDAWDRMQAAALVRQWIGISADELGRIRTSRDPWIVNYYPLAERRITRLACLEWLRDRGYPDPPRSACVYCPLRSNAEWRWLRDNDPAGFADAVAFDKTAREMRRGTEGRSAAYLHRSLVPLDEADLRSDVDRGQLLLWEEECTGLCGA